MVWPDARPSPELKPVPGYRVQVLPKDADDWWLDIQCGAVPHYTPASLQPYLTRYRGLALPDGILVAIDASSGRPVATAGTLQSPRRDHFQNGGEIGWVATVPDHRGRGLGAWLCTRALSQLIGTVTVETIFLSTGADMPAAIRLYTRLGFLPYIYTHDLLDQWNKICSEIGLPFEPDQWIKTV